MRGLANSVTCVAGKNGRMRRLLTGAISLLAAACGQPTEPASARVSGVYVLERLNGVAMPAILGSFATCPGPISYGELGLGPTYADGTPQLYTFAVYRGRACEPAGDPVDQRLQVGEDAGFWSVDGDRVTFKSVRAYGFGTYYGQVPGSNVAGAPGPMLEFTIGGQAYLWRRVRPPTDSHASLPVSAIDEQGRIVNGVRLEVRESSGLVSNGVTSFDRPFGLGAVPGVTVTIHARLPTGYAFAPGQANPVSAVVGSTTEVIIRVVRTSTS